MKVLWFISVSLLAQVFALSKERCWKNLEITFMIDHKKCVGEDIQNLVTKPLLRDFVQKLREKHNGEVARVSLITYGKALEISHSILGPQSKEELLVGINNVKFQPGKMGLDDALEQCATKPCFPVPADDAPEVVRIIIVLSNGKGDDLRDLQVQAKDYTDRGFQFYSHHVDDFSSYASLKSTLNVQNSEKCEIDFVGDLALTIEKSKCPGESPNVVQPPPPPTPPKTLVHGDVAFVIDSSFSLSNAQWEQEVDFAREVVMKLVTGDTGARFAGLSFDHRVRPSFPLNDNPIDTDKKLQELKASFLDGGKYSRGFATRTGTAVMTAMDKYFGDGYVPRAGENAKIIIVITDDEPSSFGKLREAEKRAKEENFDILAVGVGLNLHGGKPSSKMLTLVGGDASHLFYVDESAQLAGKVDEIIAALKAVR